MVRSDVSPTSSPSVRAASARSDRSACSDRVSRPSPAASLSSVITSSRSASDARRSCGPGREYTCRRYRTVPGVGWSAGQALLPALALALRAYLVDVAILGHVEKLAEARAPGHQSRRAD